ncbi:histidine--tRNA ligase [Buchnera aphidicola]|uniref:Histidine--tRNA ligase n=1 Tax=Buchnera aphidicola subsp. Tuberolachnus salignus TaxID=98804 RepID=A0A160SY69_BUCTT|nr:histidine--tRNA ligase [Buchnera aphidicola]CUR53164.1 Histidine--tRNA ligase [Buchnera aphidicola (Tuberolachnus salignus)]
MNYQYQSIRGMHDYMPEETEYLNFLEEKIKKILKSYFFSEIRFPILEKTDIFNKIIGNYTDIIQKEMYSFLDKKKNSISLRPEGTTSCIRACIQNNIFQINKIQKLWYLGPMFRYERPQKGRFRQFSQFGIENFGSFNIITDFELLKLTIYIWKSLNILHLLKLEINSIGTVNSRKKYCLDLKTYLQRYESQFNPITKKLLYENPIRLLDNKCLKIQNLISKGPCLIDYLNKKSRDRFKNLCFFLKHNKISYKINYQLVRGLDYYNDTVFEWKTNLLGSQNTVCAGGRYDTLVENLGGPKIPAIGCAIGMERLLLLYKLDNLKKFFLFSKIRINILCKNELYNFFVLKIAEKLRHQWPNLYIKTNFINYNFSQDIKNSLLNHTKFLLILKENELFKNKIVFNNLFTQTKSIINFNRIFKKPCIFI